jgi:hypothetical protein
MEEYVGSPARSCPTINTDSCRWDDWVPQDRLRKFTEENQELARNLKREMDSLRNQNKPTARLSTGTKRKGDGSSRGSEERGLAPAGKKRGRDFETEKVRTPGARASARLRKSSASCSNLVCFLILRGLLSLNHLVLTDVGRDIQL